jgi:hypothetical protein
MGFMVSSQLYVQQNVVMFSFGFRGIDDGAKGKKQCTFYLVLDFLRQSISLADRLENKWEIYKVAC